jgi:hypothetical protein
MSFTTAILAAVAPRIAVRSPVPEPPPAEHPILTMLAICFVFSTIAAGVILSLFTKYRRR